MVPAAPSAADFGGCRPAGRHCADHKPEDREQRQHVNQERPPALPEDGRFVQRFRRRQRRIEPAAQHDKGDEHRAHDQARYDAADQEAGDRDAGETAEQHRQRRRRNQHVDAADPDDRAHGEARMIAARQHGRQHQRAEEGGGCDGGAGNRREHRAGDDRNHRQPPGHAAYQQREGIDRLHRDAGLEQHFAHQHEERYRRQREGGHRLHRVAVELDQPDFAAEKDRRSDNVDRKECERHRQADRHQADQSAEQKETGFDPSHGATRPKSLPRGGRGSAAGGGSGTRIRSPAAGR